MVIMVGKSDPESRAKESYPVSAESNGSLIVGIAGAEALLVGDMGRLGGSGDFGSEIRLRSKDSPSSLPSLSSFTVDGSFLPVFLLYPSASPTDVIAPMPPVPLGTPRSSDLEVLTATGGFGKDRLLGEP